MAFIVTSKNKARPEKPRASGRFFDFSADTIPNVVEKSQDEISSQRAWMGKSYDERSRIALDQAKQCAREAIEKNGGEIKDANRFESFFNKAAENKDRKE